MKIELTDPLFLSAQPVLQRIESHGYEAYFVGGCVRDTLLNRKIHDIDIATSALPEEIESIFKHTIDVGKAHGTIIVVVKRTPYEITTFRTEGDYLDFRRPENVTFVRDLQEDTLRRDFTINAMALNRHGEVFDFYQGQQDLQNRLIRAVGDPHQRFQEDALRMMRAIRFASQLGFDIEKQTLKAIGALVHLLANISIERVRIELDKFFTGAYFKENADLLYTTGIAKAFPLLQRYEERLPYAMNDVTSKKLPSQPDSRLMWALWLKGLQLNLTDSKVYLKQWTHSNQFVQDVIDLMQLDDILSRQALTLWEIYRYKEELIEMQLHYQALQNNDQLSQYEQLLAQRVIISKNDIIANGKQIMDCLGIEKGNASLGKLMKKIEYAIVMKELSNDLEAICSFAIKNYQRGDSS